MGIIGLIIIIMNISLVYKAFENNDKSKHVQLAVSIFCVVIVAYILLPSVTNPSMYLRYNYLISPVEDYRDQISDTYSLTMKVGITDNESPFKEANIIERSTGAGLWWKEIDTESSENHVLITLQADSDKTGNVHGTISLESDGFNKAESKEYEINGAGNDLYIELADGTSVDASDWLKDLIHIPSDDDMTAMSKTVDINNLCPLISLIDTDIAGSIQGHEMEWVSDVMFPTKETKWFNFLGDSMYAENISHQNSETGKTHTLNVGVQRRFEFEKPGHKRGGTKGQYMNGILNQLGLYEVDDDKFVPSLTTGGL